MRRFLLDESRRDKTDPSNIAAWNQRAILKSLMGLDTKEAWDLRIRLMGENENLKYVAISLGGLNSPQAWELRERLFELEVERGALALGTYGSKIAIAVNLGRSASRDKEK